MLGGIALLLEGRVEVELLAALELILIEVGPLDISFDWPESNSSGSSRAMQLLSCFVRFFGGEPSAIIKFSQIIKKMTLIRFYIV